MRRRLLLQDQVEQTFTLGIQTAARLVEDEDAGFPQECPGDRQSLPLAPREPQSPQADRRVELARARPDRRTEVHVVEGGPEISLGGPRGAVAQALSHASLQHEALLINQADLLADVGRREAAHVLVP